MLSALQITNFKCFRDKKINFAPLTVLVGANGAGKSSVMQALLLTRQSLEELYTVYGDRTIETKTDVFEIVLNRAYMLQLGNASSIFTNPVERDICFRLSDKEGSETEIHYTFDGHDATHILQATVTSNSDVQIPLSGAFRYLHAERLGPRKALEMAPTTKVDVGYQGEYVSHAMYSADKTKRGIHENMVLEEKASRFSHHVEAWMQFLFPDLQLKYSTLDDQNMVKTSFSNGLLDNRFTSPTNTGFGISYTLPVVVAGLLLSTEINPTFVVENPEAHLHPLGQSRMGRFLAALSLAGVQVIVETHSEHIVNGMRIFMARAGQHQDFSVQFFMKSNNEIEVKTLELMPNGELSKWPEGFFDQEQQDLKELLMIKRMKGKKQ